MPCRQPDALTAFVAQTFVAAGAKQEHADLVATSLVNTNLTGHDSHGVVRVPQYLMLIHNGDLDPKADPAIEHETPVTARRRSLDAGSSDSKLRHAHGHRQSAGHGMAAVALINCGHVGRLGEWTLMAADAGPDRTGLLQQRRKRRPGGTTAAIATPGHRSPSASFPLADRPSIMVDFATSAVAEADYPWRLARERKQVAGLDSRRQRHGQHRGPTISTTAGALHSRAQGLWPWLMMEFLGGVFTGRGCSIFPSFQTGNEVLFIVLRRSFPAAGRSTMPRRSNWSRACWMCR
ncbi:MAG: Ldh family oxidoreductase [Caldilineaceae bacterium]